MTRFLPLLALSTLAASPFVLRPVRAESPQPIAPEPALNEAIRATAPALLKYLRDVKKYQTVGVLKFEVRRSGSTVRDDVGELNTVLAHKTETALSLARPVNKDSFRIVPNPSQFVAANVARANHKTADGRAAFFDYKYPADYGKGELEVSAFVVGIATFSADLQKIKVEYQVFDRSCQLETIKPEHVAAIQVETDPATLGEARKSYAVSTMLVAGPPGPLRTDILESIRQNEVIENEPNNEPLQALKNSPVKWEILHGDEPMKVIGNTVQEPVRGKSLGFRLTNVNGGSYAVVLMVNGKNTLYEERVSAIACRKWVLEKSGSSLTVSGFQTGQNKQQLFEVLEGAQARQQFKDDEFNYKDGTAGTFRLVVYAGHIKPMQKIGDPAVARNSDALVMRGIRGNPRSGLAKQPQTLAEVQSLLRNGERFSQYGRGYVSKSAKTEENPTQDVYFELMSETPVADITLRYFTPER